MDGQYSLFGAAPLKKRKPCEYSFARYIGQIVKDHRGIHVIADIEEYYTIFSDNTCGTPHDLSPVNESEFKEMIDVEIEYNEWMLNGSNKSIAEKNLKILRGLINDRNNKDD